MDQCADSNGRRKRRSAVDGQHCLYFYYSAGTDSVGNRVADSHDESIFQVSLIFSALHTATSFTLKELR